MRKVTLIAMCVAAGIANAQTIRQISLQTNDLIFNPVNGQIYVSVPSTAGVTYGNSVTRIDPSTAAILGTTFMGSEPTKLALSDDGSKLFAGFSGSNTARSYDIASNTPGTAFSLGIDSFFGPQYAEDIRVMPGSNSTIAVARYHNGVSARSAGVAIYDNGIARTKQTNKNSPNPINSVAWSNPNLLYGYNSETTGFNLNIMTVDSSGLTNTSSNGNLITGFGTTIQVSGGLVYGSNGRVVDAQQNLVVGTFAANGPMAIDPPQNHVYFLTGSGTTKTISIFDKTRFVLENTITVPNVNGNVSSLTRFGTNGLAFRNDQGVIYLVNSNVVPEPSTVLIVLCCLGLPLARRRKR